MDTKDIEYLNSFEEKIQDNLLKLCTDYGMLAGVLLATDDLDDLWKQMAPEYISDAVKEIKDYPEVSVSWAMYLGMAAAYGWDADWQACSVTPYKNYYGAAGFDDMDDHIVRDILGCTLDGKEARLINDMVRRCGQASVSLIRYENIEPSTPLAFYAFARVVKVMFRVGAAMQMFRMGYKFEKAGISDNRYS